MNDALNDIKRVNIETNSKHEIEGKQALKRLKKCLSITEYKRLKGEKCIAGLNNKIKRIKRRYYGIFKLGSCLDHLYQRIFFDIQGYALFK